MIAEDASVTSKGQVTIPKKVREKLGIGPGSEVSFILRGGEAVIMPKSDDPLDEMKDMRSEMSFSGDEIESMVQESKKAWDRK